MKLYTELDIKAIGEWAKQWDLYELDKENNSKPPMFKEFIESLTPIELPSDEEIEKLELEYAINLGTNMGIGFKIGCQWMKEMILNQSK